MLALHPPAGRPGRRCGAPAWPALAGAVGPAHGNDAALALSRRLLPRPQARPHHRGPGGCGADRGGAHDGGAVVPAARALAQPGFRITALAMQESWLGVAPAALSGQVSAARLADGRVL